MEQYKKIGILGGTFNPIHNGHIQIAEEARRFLALDQVVFLPSGTSYMKQNVLDAKIRYEMTRLATLDYDYFTISDIEAKREGNSYTFETLQLLKEQNPNTEYYFIMGADSLYAIMYWKHPDIICRLATLVCAVRDDKSIQDITQQATQLHNLFQANVKILPMSHIDISSTAIREAVADMQDISAYVPQPVAAYIKEKHLYQFHE